MHARILVVDDEKFIIEAISQHLTHLGHEVLAFTDPKEALEAIKVEKIDLVLTDLRMPEVSGMDITRAVYDTGYDTRVLILTGYATLDSAIESVELSVYAYLSKPFDLRELGHVVTRALTEQHLERENQVLNEQIVKMLDDMTTLHEVTRLIYDTDDFEMTLDFVLDTLNVGLGITHSALLFINGKDEFELKKLNFPDGAFITKKMEDVNWEQLRDAVPGPEPVNFDHEGALSELIESISGPNEPINSLQATPIWYRESLLGYLLVFQSHEMESITEDQATLFRIMATQIAPQVHQAMGQAEHSPTKGYLARSHNILRDRINLAITEGGQKMAISLLRLGTDRIWSSFEQLEEFQTAVEELIKSHAATSEVHWLGGDTAMVFFPDSSQTDAELICMAIDSDFVRGESVQPPTDMLERGTGMHYASSSWPSDGESAASLLTLAWFRLMSEIQREETRPGEVSSEDD